MLFHKYSIGLIKGPFLRLNKYSLLGAYLLRQPILLCWLSSHTSCILRQRKPRAYSKSSTQILFYLATIVFTISKYQLTFRKASLPTLKFIDLLKRRFILSTQ